jgi:hypothetical protein
MNSDTQQQRNDQGKFMQVGQEPMAKTARCTRYPVSVDAILGTLPNQSAFIRQSVIDRMKAEGLLPE